MARIIFLVVFFIVGVIVSYQYLKPSDTKPLPVLNPVDIEEEEMVDPELLRIGYGHKIGSFSFKDQDGEEFTDKELNEKIYVAEYFFTTCKTICPRMNVQMQRVQKAFTDNPDVHSLSFTVDPETDDVEQLGKYATRHHADSRKWHFLTGSKEDLYALARKSFFVLKPVETENVGDAGSDFIHTNNFVLIDREARIRGYYDGTSTKEVNQLIKDIETLLKE